MPDPNATLSQLRKHVARIVRDDDDLAAPLIALIKGLVPEDSDPGMFCVADQLMQELTILTPRFEAFYRSGDEESNIINLRQ
jgi:hypothetical protein